MRAVQYRHFKMRLLRKFAVRILLNRSNQKPRFQKKKSQTRVYVGFSQQRSFDLSVIALESSISNEDLRENRLKSCVLSVFMEYALFFAIEMLKNRRVNPTRG